MYVSPEGEQFNTWAQVQEYCKSHDIHLEAADSGDSDFEPEPDFELADMLHWLHTAAAESPEWPSPGGGLLMQMAFARIRTVLTIDPMSSGMARRALKPA